MDVSTTKLKKKKPDKEIKKFQCDICKKKFQYKSSLRPHLKRCEEGKLTDLTCNWCKLEFKNRGNLVNHALRIHNDKSLQTDLKPNGKHKCSVCKSAFREAWMLTHHIRRVHFNLISRAPYCDLMQINQVWFEKVIDTNIIVEMSKITNNMVMIKKMNSNGNIQVAESYRKRVDLSHLYPTGKTSEKVMCQICKKVYFKRELKKHMVEIHDKIEKHHCNNCSKSFKQSYAYLKHVCGKQGKKKRANSPVPTLNLPNQ